MYAMFTARKLLLTSRINQIQTRMLQITEQRRNIIQYSSIIADGELSSSDYLQSSASARNAGVSFFSSANTANVQYTGAGGVKMSGNIGAAVMADSASYQAAYQQENGRVASAQEIADAEKAIRASYIQDLADKQNTENVARAEKMLQLEQEALQTQLDAAMKELEAAKEAETKGIEMATPKYGGSGR